MQQGFGKPIDRLIYAGICLVLWVHLMGEGRVCADQTAEVQTLATLRAEIQSLVDELYAKENDAQYRARARIREIGQPVIPALILDLTSSSSEDRWHAAVALGVIGSQASLPALELILKEDDVYLVRGCAARAIGEICGQYDSQEGIPLLIEALDDRDAFVVGCAVEGLVISTGASGPRGVENLPTKEAVRLWKAWWEEEAVEIKEQKAAVKEEIVAIQEPTDPDSVRVIGLLRYQRDLYGPWYLCVAVNESDEHCSVRVFRSEDGQNNSILTLRNIRRYSHMYPQDVTGDGKMELIVIWRDSASEAQYMDILSLKGESLVSIFRGDARNGFKFFDLNMDGIQELFASGTDDNLSQTLLHIYRYKNGTYQMIHTLVAPADVPFPISMFTFKLKD